jgi:hypothetical protein
MLGTLLCVHCASTKKGLFAISGVALQEDPSIYLDAFKMSAIACSAR